MKREHFFMQLKAAVAKFIPTPVIIMKKTTQQVVCLKYL